jgi:hypothetical protein
MITRHSAKQYTLGVLYGGSPNVAKKPNSNPWKLTEEEIKIRQTLKEFKQEHMNEPFKQYNNCPVMDLPPSALRPIKRGTRQSEDRMYRAFVVPFKVEAFNDLGDGVVYTVHATSALDARCMAFVLDGGCQLGLKHWDDGCVELALAHTKVVG